MGIYHRKYNKSVLKKRLYAFTMDLFLVTMINKVIINSYVLYLQTVFYHFSEVEQARLIASLEQVFISIFALLFFSYFALSHYLGNGQTPGKILFALRVVRFDNELPLNFIQSTARTILQAASCLLFFVPLIICFMTPRGRGLHEWLSFSKCVHVKQQERRLLINEKAPTTVSADENYPQAA